jgi:dihydroorotate dehydrogenase
MYRLLFSRVLARFDAETMHHVGFWLVRVMLWLPPVRALVRSLLAPREPALTVSAFGRTLDGPIGLAAGFDKNAVGYEALHALGFGFVEVGTVTGHAQTGNPRPRLFRFVKDRAIVNRMGFNNAGSLAAVARLRGPRKALVGVNIGKTKVVSEERAIEDYVLSTERLARYADYLVVNVSSPNTPGLRNLQAVELLRPLLLSVRKALDEASPGRRVPLLVKIAPDLADDDIDAVCDLALELELDGIIATNTTISRRGLVTSAAEVERIGAGGLSGAPLKDRALEVLRRLRRRAGNKLLLIGVGGVESAEDVLERILAGATLVQVYTGFIYGGPLFPSKLRRELAALLRARGFADVQSAIGRGVDGAQEAVAQAANQ